METSVTPSHPVKSSVWTVPNIDTSVMDSASRLAEMGKTPMFVAVDGIFSGIIAVADTVKPTSRQAAVISHGSAPCGQFDHVRALRRQGGGSSAAVSCGTTSVSPI